MSSIVAGVDSSTQSTKAVLYDATSGRPIGLGSAPHPQTYPPVSEQDPEGWWTALGVALRRAADEAGVPLHDIDALSIAGQCHGLVALDAAGAVIRPAKLWNDTVSAPQMQRLLQTMAPAEWVGRIGSVPTAAFTVSKIAWLAEHEPDAFARTDTILLPHDWITWRLTGERVTDRSEASGTGYFDASSGRYVLEILRLINENRDWMPMLPRVLGSTEAAGVVTPDAARALGLREGTLVAAGAGDQHASALGLGLRPGDVAYAFGTSGVVFATAPDPVHDPSGIVDGVADAAGGYLPLVSTLNAARVTDTFAEWLGVDHEQLNELALSARPTDGPVLVAHLDGERKPDLPDATGTLAGLTRMVGRAELARAGVEGVIFGLFWGETQLRARGIRTDGRVIVTGGGARSRSYPQALADLRGGEVLASRSIEPVASGAAIQAYACLTDTDIREVAARWAAPIEVVATARRDTGAAARFDRYLAVRDAIAGAA